MDYLKVVKTDLFRISNNAYTCVTFDTHGYMARFKVISGTLYLYCDGTGKYPIESGQTFDFVGKVTYYGSAEVQYILFDKV